MVWLIKGTINIFKLEWHNSLLSHRIMFSNFLFLHNFLLSNVLIQNLKFPVQTWQVNLFFILFCSLSILVHLLHTDNCELSVGGTAHRVFSPVTSAIPDQILALLLILHSFKNENLQTCSLFQPLLVPPYLSTFL